MPISLDPSGRLVRLGRTLLRTPGLVGEVESIPLPQVVGQFRGPAAELTNEAFEAALRNEHVERQQTLALRRTREVRASSTGLRTPVFDEPAIEARVPTPGADWGQFVLAVDESGVATFSFASIEQGDSQATRGAELRTYMIPRYVALLPPQASAETRGLARAVGMKLIKVLVFPLADEVLGRVGEEFAAHWEKAKRPYGLRLVTPQDYAQLVAAPIDSLGWEKLGKGRALLLVHGTFSRTHTAFAGLPQATVEELYRRYEGRIFAFDHYTLSEDPDQNVRWLIDRIPDGLQLDLDVLCHSRGGLVSRVLSEKQGTLSLGSRRLAVRRVVFVAAPNSGTILTDSQYMGALLEAYTNLLNFFPDNGITEILEGVVTVAKVLAVGALKGLPGLQAMLPQGPFLSRFSSKVRPTSECRYFALASDYEPSDPGLKAWAANRLTDKVFQHAANDLVVPTRGVYDDNGSSYFPITERYIFPAVRGVSHSGYFSQPEAQDVILTWLNSD